MEDLFRLVKALNKREIALIRAIYNVKSNGEEKLRSQLFETLLDGKLKESRQIIAYLNYTGSISSFSHLKRRLRTDILNIILLQETHKKVRAKLFAQSIEVKKSLLFAELLYRRGLTEIGDHIIDEGIKVSENYEFIPESYLLTDLQRMRHGITKGPKVIRGFNEKINSYLDFINSNSYAVNLFYEFTVRNFQKSNLDFEEIEKNENYLIKLQNNYEKYPYSRNGYWYHRAGIFYYNHIMDFQKSSEHGNKLLKLIEESPALYNPVVYAGTLKEIGEITLTGGNFTKAVEFFSKSLTLFNPSLNNYLLTLEALTIAYVRSNKLDEAKKIINQAKIHPNYINNKQIKARWSYFEASLAFLEGNYHNSDLSLKLYSNILLNDKGELQFYYRILYLYISYKLERFELIEYEIQSFNRAIKKVKNFKIKRFIWILKIFSKIIKNNFEIDKNIELYTKRKNDKDHKLNYIGIELVTFEYFIDNNS